MTIIAATATERLRRYRSRHRIEVDRDADWSRCDHDGIRVYQVLARRWQHDPDELLRLQREAAIEEERVARVISEASRPLRAFERPIVIEDHGGYVVTADLEDEPPAHNHFDIFDSTDDCERCAFDQLRAEG